MLKDLRHNNVQAVSYTHLEVYKRQVLDSDLLLSKADGFFDRLLIIGGGVIGMEFATIYSDLGRQVTVIEALDLSLIHI